MPLVVGGRLASVARIVAIAILLLVQVPAVPEHVLVTYGNAVTLVTGRWQLAMIAAVNAITSSVLLLLLMLPLAMPNTTRINDIATAAPCVTEDGLR